MHSRGWNCLWPFSLFGEEVILRGENEAAEGLHSGCLCLTQGSTHARPSVAVSVSVPIIPVSSTMSSAPVHSTIATVTAMTAMAAVFLPVNKHQCVSSLGMLVVVHVLGVVVVLVDRVNAAIKNNKKVRARGNSVIGRRTQAVNLTLLRYFVLEGNSDNRLLLEDEVTQLTTTTK